MENNVIDLEKAKILAKDLTKKMVEEICFVQPMDTSIWKDLHSIAVPEKDLVKQGYKPISNLKLIWIKE